jgi:hypothetical protein
MLNALITVMSDTFAKVEANKEIIIYREKASLILESEIIKSFFWALKDDFSYILVC